MQLVLLRDAMQVPGCTYGKLQIGELILQTIERPWIPDPDHPGGVHGVSCVPKGTYALELHNTEAHPDTWALVNHELGVYHLPTDIPPGASGRTAVLIHPANFASELMGCIAPGLARAASGGVPMVTASRAAFARLKDLVPWTNGHTLSIE